MESVPSLRKALAGVLAGLLVLSTTAVSASEHPYRWRSVTVGAGGFAPNFVYSPDEESLACMRTDMGGNGNDRGRRAGCGCLPFRRCRCELAAPRRTRAS
jgi:hypothetical protein